MTKLQFVPEHIANNAKRLYKDCLRLADYISNQQQRGTRLRDEVRAQFKKNMFETDPEKIKKHKEDAVRSLSNFMLFEAARIARKQREEGSGPSSSWLADELEKIDKGGS